jgi:hypothetical protein
MTSVGASIPIGVAYSGMTGKPPAPAAAETQEKKKPKPAGSSGSEGMPESAAMPVNYLWSNMVIEAIRAMIEQKFELISRTMQSFEPSEEDKIAEKDWQEAKELKALEDTLYQASQDAQSAMEELQSLISLISSPTSSPEARASLISSELSRISSKISAILGRVEDAIGNLENMNVNGMGSERADGLYTACRDLQQGLLDIKSACEQLQDQ